MESTLTWWWGLQDRGVGKGPQVGDFVAVTEHVPGRLCLN